MIIESRQRKIKAPLKNQPGRKKLIPRSRKNRAQDHKKSHNDLGKVHIYLKMIGFDRDAKT